jgi:hypothetical protein
MKQNHFLGAVLALGLALLVGQDAVYGQAIPRPAPGFWAARTLERQTLTLQQFKGKNVLLAFLLTT